MLSLHHAYGHCHALSCALLGIAPAGEVLGLYIGEEVVHSVFRVPHTETYLDAFGPELGDAGLVAKATRYARHGESFGWRTLSVPGIRALVAGDKSRAVRSARPVALRLLAAADRLGSG